MNAPAEHPSHNSGIIITGTASVHGSAVAAGREARAEHHGSPDTAEQRLHAVEDQLAEMRIALDQRGTELTDQQREDVTNAVDDAEEALQAVRAGGRLTRLTAHLQALTACLTGVSALAQTAEQLRGTVAGITG